ncbi:scaffold attachment factor B1 isoform X2 [Suncus etruscus]|uniref:scaffold attachment factor B1 isoform X2 n=1 Tax=Suncus etruscus TaxID=109475 RepID=UPI00210FB7F2|nr:scaffold attachment factor B1 isoform X2 [Suncus etruscus]
MERLRKAIEDEGGNPDEIEISSEGSKKALKRSSKASTVSKAYRSEGGRFWNTHVIDLLTPMISSGRKLEEEGVEDNGLEENSGDGQEDVETSLENLQDIDMMDISVLDEAEIDNGSVADCVEDDDADGLPESLCDSRDLAEGDLRELPEQLQEHGIEDRDLHNLDTSSSDFTILQEIEEPSLEPENEKILGILGETCKSEPVKEEGFELEPPLAQDTSSMGPDRKLAEEEDLFGSGHPEEGDLDVASESPAHAQWSKADTLLAVVKREPVETGEGGGDSPDCEPALGLEKPVEAQSSKASEPAEASSEAAAEAAREASSPEPRDSKEDVKKFAFDACNEGPPAAKESSASEGAEPNTSSVEDDPDAKKPSKDDKGKNNNTCRNFWVSGLSSTTRATDLKNLFSLYGKVVGAKVVTNARSPGARCYGFVTMSTAEEASECISHFHKTELHGKMISVEKAKNEPIGKRISEKREGDGKKEKASNSDRSANLKREDKGDRKDDMKKGEDGEKSKDQDDPKSGPWERVRTTKSGSRGTERTVVMDKSKGVPVISVKTSGSKERASKSQDRKSASREKRSVVSFDKVKEPRKSRDSESRRVRERSEREQRMQAQWEREEREQREQLEIARERLAFHRHWLERERMERERLQRERMHVVQERRREQERIHREREELRRQQELRYEQERRPAMRRPYDDRRDDAYWPEAKRPALDDRYHSDFSRQDRFHDFDHRDRGRYPDHSVDRREGSRSMMGEREGQHYPERHSGPERHGRDSRDGWGSYCSDKRMSEGRGPPPPRGRREWGDHSRRMDDDRTWQGAADGGMIDRDHKRWQGGERSMSGHSGPGHMMNRGGMSGRGSFAPSASRGHVMPRGGMQGGFSGQKRGSRPNDARFTRRY